MVPEDDAEVVILDHEVVVVPSNRDPPLGNVKCGHRHDLPPRELE
jgi:hypothetical protein